MTRDNDERPRRSWREIDQMRDSKRSGGGGRSRGGGLSRSGELRGQAAERYKGQLDRIFSGGGLPDEIIRNAPGLSELSKSESGERLDVLRAATTSKEIEKAVDDILQHDSLPRDADLLAKVLGHPRAKGAVPALELLLDIVQNDGQPENARLLKSKLQTLKLTADDDDVAELVDQLVPLL